MIRSAIAVVLGAICLGEYAAWRASRQDLPSDGARGDGETGPRTIIVLGFPSAQDGSTSWVQRYRVGIAMRCFRPGDTVVFCGAATRGSARSEAAVMADYAVLQGLPAESVVLDEHSFSTWQNIENALRLIGTGPVIIASDTFHARRARRYMWQQAPGSDGVYVAGVTIDSANCSGSSRYWR